MTPPFLIVLNGLSKSKSHLQEKVTPTPTPLAEFSNYDELYTFEYTWSTAEEGTSSPGNLDERVDSHEVLRSGIPPQLISWLS